MPSTLEKPLDMKRRGLLPADWTVPERVRERLGERGGKQRHMLEERHLLIVAHELPAPGEPEREPRFFWRDPEGGWRSSDLGAGSGALGRHLTEFETAVDRLEAHLEAADSARALFDVLREAGPMLRTTKNLHAALQAARDAVPKDRDLLIARDRAADVERACELAHAEAKNRLELIIAENAEAHAEGARRLAVQGQRLNLLAAVFLPITAVGSIFGMNLRSGVEGWGGPWVFWSASVLAVGLGLWIRAALKVSRPS